MNKGNIVYARSIIYNSFGIIVSLRDGLRAEVNWCNGYVITTDRLGLRLASKNYIIHMIKEEYKNLKFFLNIMNIEDGLNGYKR